MQVFIGVICGMIGVNMNDPGRVQGARLAPGAADANEQVPDV
jgi:hypothetical protein